MFICGFGIVGLLLCFICLLVFGLVVIWFGLLVVCSAYCLCAFCDCGLLSRLSLGIV